MHRPHPGKGQEMGNHGGKSTAKREHKGKKDEVPVDAPNYIYNSLPEAWSDGVLKHDVSLEGQPQHHELLFDHQPHIDLHIVGGHHLPFRELSPPRSPFSLFPPPLAPPLSHPPLRDPHPLKTPSIPNPNAPDYQMLPAT
jgi:hypothetical protein